MNIRDTRTTNCMGRDTMENSMNSFTNMDSENNSLAPLIPHCPVILVLDTSHSMWGKGLADMKESVQAFFKTIDSQGFALAQIDTAAVSMGDNLRMLEEFTPSIKSALPQMNIRPKGNTPICAALELALQKLQDQLTQYRSAHIPCTTPQLIILSDGESSDDFTVPAMKIRRMVRSGELFCRAIALGDSPDLDALQTIAGNEIMLPENGEMRRAFVEIGQMVSSTYEEEVPDIMGAATGEGSSEETSPEEPSQVFLLDGTNILHWDSKRSGLTLHWLLLITRGLSARGHRWQVFFDASTPYRVRPEERKKYDALLRCDPEHFIQVPAGTRADDFLLVSADSMPGSLILSNDRYNDHVSKYPWVKDHSRIIPGMVLNGFVFFPKLSLKISEDDRKKNEPASYKKYNNEENE